MHPSLLQHMPGPCRKVLLPLIVQIGLCAHLERRCGSPPPTPTFTRHVNFDSHGLPCHDCFVHLHLVVLKRVAVGVHNDEARGFLSEGFGERPIPWLSGLPTCSTDTGTMVPLWQDRLNPLPSSRQAESKRSRSLP